MRVTDLDTVELDENGGIKDADKVTESIKTEWADFIQTTQKVGSDVPKPPTNPAADYDAMSDAEYYKATYEATKGK